MALNDDSRVIEKSRMSWEDSKRLDKDFDENESVGISAESDYQNDTTGEERGKAGPSQRNNGNGNRRFDPECYDDRPFYSMLLKVLI